MHQKGTMGSNGFFYKVTKPDQMYLKVERNTAAEAQRFIEETFDGHHWESIDETDMPKGMVFQRRWPGVYLGVFPEDSTPG